MILIIDEFVNANPEATVVVWGSMIDWYGLPGWIRERGAADAWNLRGFGQLPLRCILRPLQPPGAPELPSTIAARKLFPTIQRDDINRTGQIKWNKEHQDPADQTPWNDALPVADGIAPSFDGGSPYKFGAMVISYQTCYVAIVQADGQILLNAIAVVPYRTIDTDKNDRSLALDETHFLQPAYEGYEYLFIPVNFALRITNWLLPASTSPHEMEARVSVSQAVAFRAYTEAWGAGKSQTLLLHDRGPICEKFRISSGDHHEVAVPSSPLYHIAILVGSSLMMFQRGVTDFRNEEIQYELQLEANIRALRNQVWNTFNLVLVDLLRIGLMASPQIPNWVKAPANTWLTELGDKTLNTP